MLVIARKIGQTILVGDDIEISISEVRGDLVRLAINAPRSVTIMRKEVVDQEAFGNTVAVKAAEEMMEFLNAGAIGKPAAPSINVK